MSDRFSRGWDGERHKGRRVATIYCNSEAEGDITFFDFFDQLLPLERCDILQDVIGLLEREYEICLKEFDASLRVGFAKAQP